MAGCKFLSFFILLFLFSIPIEAQVENVPLNHDVYIYLKEMKVKGIIPSINDDIPNLSRAEVKDYLEILKESESGLGEVEKNLLNKFYSEFFEEDLNAESSTVLLDFENPFLENAGGLFSDRRKYIFTYRTEGLTTFIEGQGFFIHGQRFNPDVTNSDFFGFRLGARGTVAENIGYNFNVLASFITGSRELASKVEPKVLSSIKFVNDQEKIGNYSDFEGYIKLKLNPIENMKIILQLGREYYTLGLGYGSKLPYSGSGPVMDLIKFQFNYGIFTLSSIHGSTVGEYDPGLKDNYTKYFASNRIKFSLPGLFDIGLGESIIYAKRGIEIGYLSPLAFYKYVEQSLQDRDNGTLFFDIQTSFVDNFELQFTFFMDETVQIFGPDNYANKIAYQAGFFWYSPFSIENLSFVAEYTKIRPFVYSHFFNHNTYSAFGIPIGHRAGPNADEIFLRLSYNLSSRLRFFTDYTFTRSGENIYDEKGNLLKNVGGDIFVPYAQGTDGETAPFLEGLRIYNHSLRAGLRFEPLREIYFDLELRHLIENNISSGNSSGETIGVFKFTIEY